MRTYKFALIPLILFSCIASVLLFSSAFGGMRTLLEQFELSFPILYLIPCYILLLLLHFIVLRQRFAFKPLSIFICLTMLVLTIFIFLLTSEKIGIQLLFYYTSSLVVIILIVFISVGTYGFFLLVFALTTRAQLDFTLKFRICFFLLLYAFLLFFSINSLIEFRLTLSTVDFFGLLLPGIIALSIFLTLLNILFSRIRHGFKKQYNLIVSLLLSLSASISLLGIGSGIYSTFIAYFERSAQFPSFTLFLINLILVISGFICIFLFLLFHIVNRARNKLRSLLFLTSIFSFTIYILANLYFDINGAFLSNPFSYNLNFRDPFLIMDFYHPISYDFMSSVQQILITISFLVLLILIIYLKIKSTYFISSKLLIVLAAFLCIINLSITFYAINVSSMIDYNTGRGGNSFSDLIIDNLEVITKPKSLQEMKLNQSYEFTLKLIAKDGKTPINGLKANVSGTSSSFVNLLGIHNLDCILMPHRILCNGS